MKVIAEKGSSTDVKPRTRPVLFVHGLGVIASMIVLSGCTSTLNVGSPDYGCPGMPGGVQCMSAREVYAVTNDGQVPRPMQTGKATGTHADAAAPVTEAAGVEDPVIDNYVAPRLPDQPIPIRTPAQVMRIWVAPWEDTHGDLITTGYVYTEIEPRRWVIGDGTPSSEPVLRPLQTVKPETDSNPDLSH